ncbi:MAG: adenylate/guanylate cyclase domain-containing protein, partial [Propionibacteriaceae bacterium]
FRELTVRFGYEDVFLLDTKGNVVYSAYKGVDFGTNVETGPYRGGAFQSVYESALRSNSVDFFGLTDFERYQPSLGVPTGFAASPIGQGGRIDGVLVVQLPLERINNVMTSDQQWEANGLGETGETYLVGPDKLMRTNSRELLQNPEQYQKDAINAGTAPAVAERAVQVKGSVLIQPVNTTAVDFALRGQTGITTNTGYLGREALTAYAPLDIDGLQWVIIAKVESSEAFAPVTTFARNLGVSTALLILLVSLAALLLARVFTRPIKRLVAAVQKIAAGDLETQVPVTTRDEFGDLGHSFNDMSKSLRTKAELLAEEQAENERLLLSMMPADVAKRYRQGEETIAQEHQNVSVIFADIAGTEDLARGRTSAEALALTNALVRGFDEAAERIGMEKVRTLRTGYLASCGLVTPRLDNARRTVEFAREMEQVLQRFNAQHGFKLALRAGIDTGPVTSGLVGRSSIVYDMWGDAVNLAYQVRNTNGRPGIFVTQSVYDRLRNEFSFEVAAEGDTAAGRPPTWALQTEVSVHA